MDFPPGLEEDHDVLATDLDNPKLAVVVVDTVIEGITESKSSVATLL